ncbi:MAG: hypothetical protein GXP50_04415 [Deltaproteobacteria bacterium]|nr:hypothetical protein [Deltaproteobacteria bacterium]
MTRLFIPAVVLGLLVPAVALAHKVNVFAYAEDGVVHTESYFNDGTPCQNSRIVAYGEGGKVVAEGTTDTEGMFSFPIDRPQDLRIVLEASMGHKNEVRLSAAEIGGGEPPTAAAQAPARPAQAQAPPVDPKALEQAVDRALARRLKPIRETLMRLERAQEKPNVATVLGGIGFILGLAGMYLWGRSGRR